MILFFNKYQYLTNSFISDLGVAQQKDVTLLQQPVVAPPARPFSNNNTGRCSYHPPQHRQLLAAHTSWC